MVKTITYDAVIIGGGHNGLVAACYLGKSHKKVLILEKNDYIGGASTSQKAFPDYDAYLSRYAYLVSLFPQKIFKELGINVKLLKRNIASYTPYSNGHGLLMSNADENVSKQSILKLGNGIKEWEGYQKLIEKQTVFAELVWDSFLKPLKPKGYWEKHFKKHNATGIWRSLVEQPIGQLIESHLQSDILRGVLLTDGKIGANTHAHDPSLLQNRTFIYHIIGNKTGEWRVPQGGMGALVQQLLQIALENKVEYQLNAKVLDVNPQKDFIKINFEKEGKTWEVKTKNVLWNAAPPYYFDLDNQGIDEGTAFKINMLLKKLPVLKDKSVKAEDAFAGTFHIDEGYQQMQNTYETAQKGKLPEILAGEIYCHTLTDNSILSDDLKAKGYHTLTYFGLDLPYALFEKDNEAVKKEVLNKFLKGINNYLETPLEDCLALDKQGQYCMEAKSSLDLEKELGLPRGNIFQKSLTWFFAESKSEEGQYGVETEHSNIFICGASAKRGGAVSGIPGRNAAWKILNKV